jgi:hypothetical protein
MNKSSMLCLLICAGLGWAWKSGAMTSGGGGYRVEFTGTPGAKLIGTVGWRDMKNFSIPTHMDKAEGILPHSVDLNPPGGGSMMVVASGATLGQGDVTVKIYHNGIECGKSLTEGTAALPTKVCTP